MRRIRVILSTLILVILFELILSSSVLAIDSGYVIEYYDINMVVNENNTFDITETIRVNFTSPRHGIYRKIPLTNKIQRLDGTTSKNRAKVTNISVSDIFDTYNEGGDKVIKIGNEYRTLTGQHSYTIKYTYDIGKDPLKDADELYFNLIGSGWDTSINDVTFRITMPKDFDETLLGFSRGYGSSVDSSNISYTVDGNIITGSLDKSLSYSEALTVRLTLPEGYFVGARSNLDFFSIFRMLLSILLVVVAYIIWRKHGKDESPVETVEFYPPEGLNSAEVGYLYKGAIEQKDVTSLLIYLANKGYLKIEEYKEKTALLIKSKKFKIIKLKDYDGNNEDEKMFLEDLFDSKDEVTKEDLYNKFYITIQSISKNIEKKQQPKVYEKASLGKRIIILLMIIAVLLCSLIPYVLNAGIAAAENMGMIFMFCIPLLLLYTRPNKVMIFVNCILLTFFHLILVLGAAAYDEITVIAMLIEMVSLNTLIIFLGIIRKRSKYGTEMLGKIKGFKNFLEFAEKSKLEQLVMEDPEYFYNILPYTYVLGVSDKWMKKFEDIALQAPTWYYGYSHFSTRSFNKFMNSTYSSISSTMSSSPSSSSSGGGSSGGGSGGGGGGSW